MGKRTGYKTRKREALTKYLQENSGRHVTVSDINEHFQNAGESISLATIYRFLGSMTDSGTVRKYTVEGVGSACYEYIGQRHGETGAGTFHLKCERCGQLIHLKCDLLKETGRHIRDEHGFRVDPGRTVLYGVCGSCRGDASPGASEQSSGCRGDHNGGLRGGNDHSCGGSHHNEDDHHGGSK